MKICSKCKAEKPKSEFSKQSASKDGVQPRCKVCVSEYYTKNASRIISRVKAYKEANPEKVAAGQRKYRSSNKEKLSACERRCRQKNREAVADYHRAYSAANPEKISAYKRSRRARDRSAEGAHNGADIRTIFDAQRGLCANCQTKLFKSGKQKYHVDHIMPLALGGSNWPSNLQCLCQQCNLSKSAKHPLDWAKQQGKLL